MPEASVVEPWLSHVMGSMICQLVRSPTSRSSSRQTPPNSVPSLMLCKTIRTYKGGSYIEGPGNISKFRVSFALPIHTIYTRYVSIAMGLSPEKVILTGSKHCLTMARFYFIHFMFM